MHQPEDDINSSSRTRTQSSQAEAHEAGSHAAEDEKQIRTSSQ